MTNNIVMISQLCNLEKTCVRHWYVIIVKVWGVGLGFGVWCDGVSTSQHYDITAM